jgi:phage terminase large subunit-like protein
MTTGYIKDCASWAKIFDFAVQSIKLKWIKDLDKDILVYKIRFSNGKAITALSSKPTNLRSKQGDVVLDEAAFHENLEELLKAAFALLMWGGKVRIISTHNGENSEFNQLINQIRNKEKNYYLQKTSFLDSVQEGLYKKICLKQEKYYSIQSEKEWIKNIYSIYGDAATEELDVIPRTSNRDAIYHAEWFHTISNEDLPKVFDYVVWGWDMAATDKDESCFTSGILLARKKDCFYILDWKYCKKDAKSTQDFVVDCVKKTRKNIPVFVELEGGSESILWLENSFKPLLKGYRVKGVKPSGSKLIRSLPTAEDAKNKKIYVLISSWHVYFLQCINKFSGEKKHPPPVNDLADSLSLAHKQIKKGLGGLLGT